MNVYRWMMCLGLALVSHAVGAGKIEFYESRSQGGDLIGTIPDRRGPGGAGTDYNLKNTNGWPNDQIVSMSLKWVTPGTRIQLFDSPSASKTQDWVDIVVKKWDPEIPIRHLEMSSSNKKFDQNYYNQDGNLNGKVSHIKVIAAKPVDPPLEARLNLCLQELHEFRKKEGRAHETYSQGSRYRAYFPDFTVRPDESFRMRFKVNHIRNNANDDYAIVVMEFDNNRTLLSGATNGGFDNIIEGDDSFSVVVDDIWKGIPKELKTDKYAAIAELSTRTAAAIYEKALALSEKGGRSNFPYFIEDTMNEYGKAVVNCGENKYAAPVSRPESNRDDVNPVNPPGYGAPLVSSQGRYQYTITFDGVLGSGQSQRIINNKTLVCEGNTCRWGSNDSTPSVSGCKKYRREFRRKVTAYGYPGKMLSARKLGQCNAVF